MITVEPLAGHEALREEAIELTRALIRVDSSNPPGNETAVAQVLVAYLREAGLEPQLIGPDPERLNVVTRIAGDGGPSLLLMGHTDVVPAPAENWTVPPFEAEIVNDHLVGRGAADMKNELACRAVAFAEFARGGARPRGDIVLIAESDEERNTADVGMPWLVREHPELRCDYALNEGGGSLLELADGRRLVTIAVGEKKVTALRLRVLGTAGHASVPDGIDNPLVHLASAIERLGAYRPPTELVPAVARALEVLGIVGDDEQALDEAGSLHPFLGALLPAMTRMTVTPTGADAAEPPNVIPPFADLICDCRALPGQGEAEIEAHVAKALGDDFQWQLELLEPLEGGTESSTDTPLYRACERYVEERLGAQLLPIISPGFSDSYWVRKAHDTVAYGFAPVFATDLDVYHEGAHGADERLHLDDFAEIAAFHLAVLRSWVAA